MTELVAVSHRDGQIRTARQAGRDRPVRVATDAGLHGQDEEMLHCQQQQGNPAHLLLYFESKLKVLGRQNLLFDFPRSIEKLLKNSHVSQCIHQDIFIIYVLN